MKLKTTGHYVNASLSLGGKLIVSLELNEQADSIAQINQMDKSKLLSIEIKPYRKPRSLDANALLWACIADLQSVLGGTKEEIYKRLIRTYGIFDTMRFKRHAYDLVEQSFRAIEVTYEDDEWIEARCYYGSHLYDSKEFSNLLEGTIEEMEELGIQPPTPKSVKEAMEEWEKSHNAKK